MLTKAKLKIFQKFGGDMNRWIAEAAGPDSTGISQREWEIIVHLRKVLNLVSTNRALPECHELLEQDLQAVVIDDETRQALREIATQGSFIHPILGPIIPEPDQKYWWTEPLFFEGLNYGGQICAFTRGEPPSASQLEAMINSLAIWKAKKTEMAKEMVLCYIEIRPNYLTAPELYDEIPEVPEPDAIWALFSELAVFVQDDNQFETCFSFRLGFDPGHEMNVVFKSGEI
jgi:hypothetical protein